MARAADDLSDFRDPIEMPKEFVYNVGVDSTAVAELPDPFLMPMPLLTVPIGWFTRPVHIQ